MAAPAVGLAATQRRSLETGTPLRFAPQSTPELKFRTLGGTGLRLTEVSFGCMITSDPTVIERALDLGVNFFDTARVYQNGNNERMVGAALGSRRKDVHLATKTIRTFTKAEALADLDTSLQELKTDHVDIWYLHARDEVDAINEELLDALDTAKQQGKTRFGGFSSHSTEVLNAWGTNPHMDVVLIPYNFSMDEERAGAVAKIAAAGKGVVGMKVMAGGFRSNKPGSDLHTKLQNPETFLAALKWVLKNPNVHTTIPSITDMEQLEEDLRAMSEPFSADDEKTLAKQLEMIRPLYCRTCGACTGQCPKGLAISDMIRHVSYVEGYGQFELGRQGFLALDPKVREIRCDDCDECAVQCPNGVDVVARLKRARELFA